MIDQYILNCCISADIAIECIDDRAILFVTIHMIRLANRKFEMMWYHRLYATVPKLYYNNLYITQINCSQNKRAERSLNPIKTLLSPEACTLVNFIPQTRKSQIVLFTIYLHIKIVSRDFR